MREITTTIFFISFVFSLSAQSKIAITIDDVPNTALFKKDRFESKLLTKLDSINIPIAIFINEGLIYHTDSFSLNFELLNQWTARNYTTLGNHTYSHPRYSEVGFDGFAKDIIKGETISKELSEYYNKELVHFRAPFNDLGKDTIEQIKIDSFLKEKGYISTPFTVESSDWMFNYMYEYYLKKGDNFNAKKTANNYIQSTLDLFEFHDSMALELYNRKINHIYLCHDNKLNADYIDQLIQQLSKKGYSFSSLDETMKDEVYLQENVYFKKWGISWMYRWMTDKAERKEWLKEEPQLQEIYEEYKKISAKKQ